MFLDFRLIRESVPITVAAERLGLSLVPDQERKGLFRTYCPQCEEKGGRSLTVTPALGLFTCWKARKNGEPLRGDVLSLAAHLKGISVKDAARYLADTFNISTPAKEVAEGEDMKAQGVPMGPTPPKKVNGFDRSKYQGNLTRTVEGLPADFCIRADIGVPHKGTFKGCVVIPLYDKDTGEFMEYVAVENVRRFKKREGP